LRISLAAPADIAWKSAALRNAACDPRRSVTCAAVTLRARFTAYADHASPRAPRLSCATQLRAFDVATEAVGLEARCERAQRSEPRERSEPAQRLARERVGESPPSPGSPRAGLWRGLAVALAKADEGRSPSE
jgi:hypothetical protein